MPDEVSDSYKNNAQYALEAISADAPTLSLLTLENGNGYMVFTGSKETPDYNMGWLSYNHETFNEDACEFKSFLDENGYGGVLFMDVSGQEMESARKAAEEAGYEVFKMPLMTLDRDTFLEKAGDLSYPRITVTRVTPKASEKLGPQVNDVAEIQHEAFGFKKEEVTGILAQQALRNPKLYQYVGYANEQPVVSAAFVVKNNMISVWNVGTPEDKQGRGYGSAVMVEALKEIFNDNPHATSYLVSSEAGISLYDKLGYKTERDVLCLVKV